MPRLLFGFSTLVSAIHVPGGTFIHSAVALAPHSYILALEGIAIAVAWVAARRPTWRAESATAAFTGAAIVFAVGAAAVGCGIRPRRVGREPGQVPCASPTRSTPRARHRRIG